MKLFQLFVLSAVAGILLVIDVALAAPQGSSVDPAVRQRQTPLNLTGKSKGIKKTLSGSRFFLFQMAAEALAKVKMKWN